MNNISSDETHLALAARAINDAVLNNDIRVEQLLLAMRSFSINVDKDIIANCMPRYSPFAAIVDLIDAAGQLTDAEQ